MSADIDHQIENFRLLIKAAESQCRTLESELQHALELSKLPKVAVDQEHIDNIRAQIIDSRCDIERLRLKVVELELKPEGAPDHMPERAAEQPRPKPHMLAEALTRLVTKPSLCNRILGSREERFHRHVQERSVFAAHFLYWADTLASCGPALASLTRWLVAGEFIRRFFGS